jgi:uncharacterized protein DUF5681
MKHWMAGKGRIENLKPWKPGESGNLLGRPKRRPISDRYEDRAETPLPEKERIKRRLARGATYADALALGQFNAALNGRTDAAREIREAIEGKAQQRLELANRRVEIHVKYDDPPSDTSVSETEQISGLTHKSRDGGPADSPK